MYEIIYLDELATELNLFSVEYGCGGFLVTSQGSNPWPHQRTTDMRLDVPLSSKAQQKNGLAQKSHHAHRGKAGFNN